MKYRSDISSTVDCDQQVESEMLYANKWVNAPQSTIAILRTYKYSNDWIEQEFVPINSAGITYIRKFYNGTTWTQWFKFTGV